MSIFKALLIPMLLHILWYTGAYFRYFNPYIVPPPHEVYLYIFESAKDGILFFHIISSLKRVCIGFIIAAAAAVPIGIIHGTSKSVKNYFNSMLEFLRHIPPLALIPLLILSFGIGEASKVAIIILASFFPVFLNCSEAISTVDKKLVEVGKNFGMSRMRIFIKIYIPCAMPYIFTGLQLGLGYSFRALIGAEMIAAASGLGYMIKDAEAFARYDIIFAGIIVLGISGLVVDRVFINLFKKLFPYIATG